MIGLLTEKITWIEPYFDLVLNEVPVNARTIIDVGAGSGIFGFILKKTRDCHVTAIEPFGYQLGHYDLHYKTTWQDFFQRFDGLQTFDVLVSTECIEHMKRSDALDFLNNAKRVAKKVIITTPSKFQQQPEYDDNEFQKHRCLITPQDFKKNGYSLRFLNMYNSRFGIFRLYSRYIKFSVSNMVGIFNQKP